MLRSLWIKVPTVALALAAAVTLEGAWAVAVPVVIVVLGTAVLAGVVFHPNSSAWTPTFHRAPGDSDAVALTFDDGPDPKATPHIARVLAEKEVPAAFFVVGERVRANHALLAKLHDDGHLVCNHSETHGPTFHFSLWGRFRRELRACNEAIATVIGKEPTLFRSPQGVKNPALGDVIGELGMTAVGWQVRGFDAFGGDPEKVAKRVLEGARPGGVILLHDGTGLGGSDDRSATIEALPMIIDGLRERGMRFVRLDELLEVEPYR